MRSDLTISKLKAQYCVRGVFQKILYPEPFNTYSIVIQFYIVRLMFILQCIAYFCNQIHIDFTNEFSRVDIPIEGPVFIEFPRYFNSERGKCDVFHIT